MHFARAFNNRYSNSYSFIARPKIYIWLGNNVTEYIISIDPLHRKTSICMEYHLFVEGRAPSNVPAGDVLIYLLTCFIYVVQEVSM